TGLPAGKPGRANKLSRARTRSALLRRIGANVRLLRDERDMPRSALAEASGVSLRFLAQLEAGTGNISVCRLADVAHALGTSTAALAALDDDAVAARAGAGPSIQPRGPGPAIPKSNARATGGAGKRT